MSTREKNKNHKVGKNQRLILFGAWRSLQYQNAFARALSGEGVEVLPFSTFKYFDGLIGKIQLYIPFPGLALLRLNYELINQIEKERPSVVVFWKATHILPWTVRRIQKRGIKTVSYNNDDPFGPRVHGNVPWHHHFLWFWYLKCLNVHHKNFFYRKINCSEAFELGAKHADVLLPYYLAERDRPVIIPENEEKIYLADVVFVGHYEPDGREKNIIALIKFGFKVKIWGDKYWNKRVLGEFYDQLSPITYANGDEYAKALCGGKICLVFLSKLNRDTYTRRCFEIPACGKLMLAERTTDLQRMFREDEECCFFSSTEELVLKVQWLINNPDLREKIAAAGRKRVIKDRHEIRFRAAEFLEKINS